MQIVVTPTLAGTLTNTATVQSTVTDPNMANNTSTAVTTVTEPTGGTAPVVSACIPNKGNRGQQLTVALMGSNFQAGAAANFGGQVLVQSVTFVSSTWLNVKITVSLFAISGPRPVTVTNPDGRSGTLAGCFTVNF